MTQPTATSSIEPRSAVPSLKDTKQLYRIGRLDSVELALRAILQADPKNQEARYYLSLAYRSESEVAGHQPRPWEYYRTIPQQPIY